MRFAVIHSCLHRPLDCDVFRCQQAVCQVLLQCQQEVVVQVVSAGGLLSFVVSTGSLPGFIVVSTGSLPGFFVQEAVFQVLLLCQQAMFQVL